MATARERVPGVEARAGKFPGPSLIPALYAIQERVGWLPREELVALAREVHRPLYEIEGLISFYPHFLTEPPKRVALHACRDLSCWLHGARRADRGDPAAVRARTPTSSSPRCPASAGATRRPPSASTSARRRRATPRR